MADHGILFSAPMVRALLAGTKTQTRRVLNPQPGDDGRYHDLKSAYRALRIAPGDRLLVRESYFQFGHWEPVPGEVTRNGGRQKWRFIPDNEAVRFDPPSAYRKGRHAGDPATPAWHQRLGRFMPRRYSRLTLLVTDRRVQRVRDISEEDAVAEGVAPFRDSGSYISPKHPDGKWRAGDNAYTMYRDLWNAINGAGSWDANPWCVAYTFAIVEGER